MYFTVYAMLYPQDRSLSGKETQDLRKEHLLLVGLHGQLVEMCSGRSPGRTAFICISMFEATNCNYSSFKSEFAHDNYTMKSLLFILHVFCSIYCTISSQAQLQRLSNHFLSSSYPLMDYNYLALQSKQCACTALLTAILSVAFVLAT